MKMYLIVAIDIILLLILTIKRLHVLWFPRNYEDLTLAFIFGLCITMLGTFLLLIIKARDTDHLGSIQRIMLRLTNLFILIIIMFGLTLVFAFASRFLAAPVLSKFDLFTWCLDVICGFLISVYIMFGWRKNSKLLNKIFYTE